MEDYNYSLRHFHADYSPWFKFLLVSRHADVNSTTCLSIWSSKSGGTFGLRFTKVKIVQIIYQEDNFLTACPWKLFCVEVDWFYSYRPYISITRSKTSIRQKIAFISAQIHSSEKGRENIKLLKDLSNYTKSMCKVEKNSISFLKHSFIQLQWIQSNSLSLSRLNLNCPSGTDFIVELKKELKNGSLNHMRLWGVPKNYVNQKERHVNTFKTRFTFLVWFDLFAFFRMGCILKMPSTLMISRK